MHETPQPAVPARITPSQREATARHHEKMARLFRDMGRSEDAASAERMALRLRESM